MAMDSMIASGCRSLGGPISLPEGEVMRRRHCAHGAHVVLLGTSGLASMVMRGQMMQSVLRQTLMQHGANSSYVLITAPYNDSSPGYRRDSTMLENHFDAIGSPSACVLLKYAVQWVGVACRRRGALVLVDSIDNHRAFSHHEVSSMHYRAMDAGLVQTRAHAAQLAETWVSGASPTRCGRPSAASASSRQILTICRPRTTCSTSFGRAAA